MFNRRVFLGVSVAASVLGSAVLASDEKVLLTVSGLGDPIEFTQSRLAEIGTDTFNTSTIWTEGVHEFTGVPLTAFLASLDVTTGAMFASAVNDYTIEFPVEDALQDGPMIAYLLDGAPMSVRDKGPLWIVYPYDSNPDFQTEDAYARSIWQLDRIEIRQ